MPYNHLTEEEQKIILHAATEYPGSGKLLHEKRNGTFICKQCNFPLYASHSKFDSHCGWPSFDDQIANHVVQRPDPDGRRVEIVCANCLGHLGHVFVGERFTPKDTRHCVNSLSLVFVESSKELPTVLKE